MVYGAKENGPKTRLDYIENWISEVNTDLCKEQGKLKERQRVVETKFIDIQAEWQVRINQIQKFGDQLSAQKEHMAGLENRIVKIAGETDEKVKHYIEAVNKRLDT